MKTRIYKSNSDIDYKGIKNLMIELCKVTNSEFDEKRFKSTINRRAMDKYNSQGIIIAEDENEIVGMILAAVLVSPSVETYGNISNFVVYPNYRGKGVGKALIDAAFEFFKEMGVSRVETNVRDLEREGKLFNRYGFEKKFIVMEKKISMDEISKPY
ncbi:MAG: GNAT family N-acetyltransferase [Candidatus Helarchaeota archaeon]|nr:GNAT family N-acetyltransferase [Candidatus Helarchaeota archaeon]